MNLGDTMIKIKSITKKYGNQFAVNNVSLEIQSGEVFGFVGPNGAGKSTTIKAILNYIFLDNGSITVLGLDAVKDNVEIKQHVAYVPSEVNFYPTFTALELINLSARAHDIQDDTMIDVLCRDFQIDKHKKLQDMSLGNKKKVAIACALIVKPKILIMDEPTSGLDPLIQKVLFSYIKKLSREGVATFISSHNLKEVQDHCDRVAFIKNGEVLKIADLSEYTHSGKYIKITGDVSQVVHFPIKILSQKENTLSFIFEGDLSLLFKSLLEAQIDDILIEDLSIEHQFLELYKEEETHDTTPY